MEKSFYGIIFLALVVNIVLEIIFQLTYLTSETEANLTLNLVLQDSVFTILGFLAAIASYRVYNVFMKKEEISTVNFLLDPKKLKEEIRFFHILLVVVFVCWSFFITVDAVAEIFPDLFYTYKRVFSVLFTSYGFSSFLLATGTILVFNRWRRRVLTHG